MARLCRRWALVARYTVYRGENRAQQVLHTSVTYDEAKQLRRTAEAALAAEPGYRPYAMCRALIGIRLDDPEQTRLRYQELEDSP